MKLEVTVNDDIFYKLLVAELDDSITSLEDDIRRYIEDYSPKPNVFFWDEPEKDITKISEHINALRIVRSWYSVPEA